MKGEICINSVYADLEYKNFEEMETKATLVIAIGNEIKNKKLAQVKAAKTLGISQPKLSELLNGHFSGYSVERLIHFLNELEKDVDIVIRSKPKSRRGRVNVYSSNHSTTTVSIAVKGRDAL
jgi:predicted XRE-type DNA-binding protein